MSARPAIVAALSAARFVVIGLAVGGPAAGCAAILGADFEKTQPGSDGGSGSGDPSETPSDDGSSDGEKAGQPQKDGGGDAKMDAPKEPLCPAPMPGAIPWKDPAAPSIAACTVANILFVKTALANSETIASIRAQLKATRPACESCMFSTEASARWGPIVYQATYGDADSTGEKRFLNYGGCVINRGGTTSCAKDLNANGTCVQERCSECPDVASETSCAELHMTAPASCGKYYDQALTSCAATPSLPGDCAKFETIARDFCDPL